ncbi:MAG: biopolymer transporter ExbD, partial [Planctomycetota bacterium]
MRLREDTEGDEFAPNLTSMTDIVFLMLVFFMLATTFVDPEKALGIELPGAASASDAPAEELVLNVLEDGTYVVGGASLDAEGLRVTTPSPVMPLPRSVTVNISPAIDSIVSSLVTSPV